jgi:hypothetical protein
MSPISSETTGALIAHDKVDRYRPLGAFGKPAYQSHVQLRAMLLAKRGPRFANYFAKPTYDADTGELRWTAEVPGEARAWHEMSAEEQAQRALDLEAVRSGLASYAQELRAQASAERGGTQAFASLLEQALKVPAQGSFLYFVGEQPVIAFWGFETHAGGSVDAAALAPQFAPRGLPPEPPRPLGGVAAAGAAAADLSLHRRRPWWWWLLWALLALLLLIALLLALRACTTDPPVATDVPFTGAQEPDKSLTERDTPPLDSGGQPDLAGPRDSDAAKSAIVEGRDAGTGPDELALRGADARADTKGLPGDESSRSGLPDQTPFTDRKSEPMPFGDRKGDSGGVGDKPQDKGLPDALADKADRDALTRKDRAQPLDLPSDTKGSAGMGFLAGRWRAGEGLADRETGQPLDLSFNFNKEGKGEVTVRRPDGSTCKGTVEGTMSGGRLSIAGSQSIPCSGGGSYAAPRIECTKARNAETQCFGMNKDGSKYYMGIQRQP